MFRYLQTVGEERGQVILERADPIFLIFALPLVPIGLVLGRMIPWEEPVRSMGNVLHLKEFLITLQ